MRGGVLVHALESSADSRGATGPRTVWGLEGAGAGAGAGVVAAAKHVETTTRQ